MSYQHIENLYKDQLILLFRECYALEKVHGRNAYIAWESGGLTLYGGGVSPERFAGLFDREALAQGLASLGQDIVTIYGEAYGGSAQKGTSHLYGAELRFIAFDVQIGGLWLAVPDAEEIVGQLGLEFVPYAKVSTETASLDAERDRPSEVAVRRGMGAQEREGIVLRPPIEVRRNNGERIIAKHKRDAFAERVHPPKVVSPEQLEVLASAHAIADEWVTANRLDHVLDGLTATIPTPGIEHTRDVIMAMVEDVYREAKGEIVESRAATNAIGRRAAQLFKARLQER